MTTNVTTSIEQLISTSWDRRLADDLATEMEAYSGEKRHAVEEMRRFLAVKACREQLRLLQEARDGRKALDALRAAAHAMRSFALARPALAAAAFRTPPPCDDHEWQELYARSRDLLLEILAECGLRGPAAAQAIYILRSLVRGFVLHEFMNSFLHIFSYEESFEHATNVFIAGLPALTSCDELFPGAPGRQAGLRRDRSDRPHTYKEGAPKGQRSGN